MFHNLAVLTLLVAFGLQSIKDRAMRFALVGTVLSLVPLSAAPTPQRVLLIPRPGTVHGNLQPGLVRHALAPMPEPCDQVSVTAPCEAVETSLKYLASRPLL